MMDLNETLKELGCTIEEDGSSFGLAELPVGPILTVGKLMEILGMLDPKTQVTMDDTENEWWSNIDRLGLPTDGEGYSTLTFFAGHPYDTWQL